jgi:hypothetical protein
MKKLFSLISSLLIFAGVKAQTQPTIKKETVVPVQPGTNCPMDSLKAAKAGINLKQTTTTKAIKFDQIKNIPPVQMKETPALVKPHKG